MSKEGLTKREFLYAFGGAIIIASGIQKFLYSPETGEQVPLPDSLWGDGDKSIYNIPGFPDSLENGHEEAISFSRSLNRILKGR